MTGGNRSARRPRARRRRRLLRFLGGVAAALLLLGAVGVALLALTGWIVYRRQASGLGDISALLNQDDGPAQVLDRNGKLLYAFEDPGQGLHETVPLRDISSWLPKATVATEDATFYSNPGINFKGLLRAGIENFFPGRGGGFMRGSGGSSITQQLVKNVLIPEDERTDRTVDRKVREAVLAIEITKRYPKDRIIEWYLNRIYYGNRAYGIGAAARRYFGVTPDKLTLAQASLLAGIPQSPVAYDPLINPDAAKLRQGAVLDLMVKHGQVTAAQAEAARTERLAFVQGDDRTALKAPHWVFYIQDQLLRRFGEATVYRAGLRVTTTLDLSLQEKAQAIVERRVSEFEQQNCGCHNGAVVAVDNRNGQVLAMVGSRDFFNKDIQGEVNNAVAAKQPGSALKPAVYLATFLKGWHPATVLWDVAKSYANPGGKPFVPVGPTANYNGPVTVRQALGSSLNAPAVAAAAYAGVPAVIDTAHKLGINTMNDPNAYGVAIATGGANVTLLDMTYMYSTLANNGAIVGEPTREQGPRRMDPVTLLKVTDGRGRTLYEFREPRREQVVPAAQAYEITSMLSDDGARGLIYQPGSFDLRDKRPLAAKTGTQQGAEVSEIRSTWNFGYVPDLTVGVWVGNADGSLVRNITSASSSLRIWRDVMQAAVDGLEIPPKPFPVPLGLVRARVTVPGPKGCVTVEDLIAAGQAAQSAAAAGGGALAGGCRLVNIDTRNGLLAGPDTPEEFVKQVTYIDAPAEAAGWPATGGIQIGPPPRDISTLTASPSPSPSPTAPPSLTPTPSATRPPTLTPRTVTATAASVPQGDVPAVPAGAATIAAPRVVTPVPTATVPPPPRRATAAAPEATSRPDEPGARGTPAAATITASPVATPAARAPGPPFSTPPAGP